MNPQYYPEKLKNPEDIQSILASQVEDYQLLFIYTSKLKKMLVKDCIGNSLEEIIKVRGVLIDKLTTSKKYYDSLKEIYDFTDNDERKLQLKELAKKIRQLLEDTVSLNAENISLMKQRIKNIVLSLEKIKEGKCFISNLAKHIDNTPSFIDICG
ncbi:MAG: hypothetical protein HRF42_11985 [Candidatus Brocadia sp.]|jgi:flagellar biosynthesis/type III secretory pathway chaperone